MKTNVIKKGYFSILINQLLIFLACLLICAFCSVSLFTGLKYFLFQLSCLYLPGLALFHLLKINKRSFIDISAYSFVFGLTMLMLEYYLMMLIGLSRFSFVISLFILLISCFYLYRNKGFFLEIEADKNQIWLEMIIILTIVVCFFFLSYSFVYPDVYGGTVYDKDFLYWIGNSISFIKGLPVQDYRLVGEPFYYHYFSNIVMAQTSFVTGIDLVTLSYYFSYIVPCVLLVYCTYIFLKTLVKNNIYIFLGMVIVLLFDGMTSYVPDHLYYCPFGFDYAYALSMLSFAVLSEMYQAEDYSAKSVLLSCLFLMLTTGFKGPNGVVVLFAYGIVTLSLLLRRKWIKGLMLGAVWLFSFFLIYFVFIADITQSVKQTNDLEFLGPLLAFDYNPFAIKILNKLIGSYAFPNNGITRIISLFLYIVLNNVGAMVLLAIGVIGWFYRLVKRQDLGILSMAAGTALWGILLTNITHQDGNSQMYFIMSSLPFCAIAGLYVLDQYFTEKKYLIILSICLCILAFPDVKRFADHRVIANINDSIILRDGGTIGSDHRYYFTKEEYELALWIKDNTSEEDYVVLDHFSYDGLRKEEMLGVFSERYIWNDGQYSTETERERRRQLVLDAFEGNREALKQLKAESVDYLVQTVSETPNPKLNDLEIVYNKGGYTVYKID